MPDEFDWETGLFSGVGTVIDEWFAVTENGPNTCLFLKVVGDEGGDGNDLRYGCGPDWASFDGGETVEHPKGENRRFNVNTAAAELFREAFSCGAEGVLRQRSQQLYAGKGPANAKLWHGLKFKFEVKTEHRKFKDRDTGEMIERDVSRVIPVEFLGEHVPAETVGAAVAQPTSTQTASNPSEASAGAPGAGSDDPLSGLSAEDAAKVKVLAKTLPYPEWVDKVMELPNAVASSTLMVALGDEVLYGKLKEG